MRSQLLKVSAILLASALTAPLTFAQEEADAEAPPPPTPQEIAADNLAQLLVRLASEGIGHHPRLILLDLSDLSGLSLRMQILVDDP